MIKRTTRLRWRRRYRQGRRQVGDIGVQADEQLEQHFFRRIPRIWQVRRFIAGWIALLVVLSIGVVFQTRALGNHYLQLEPTSGGTHTEGIVGSFTTANPLYATNTVDQTVSRLVFAGLLSYDNSNKLVGDLAESWTIRDDLVYTVVLKPGLKWHDGVDLTAEDVAFTFKTAQNPDAKSPLFGSWRGVKIEVVDNRTITFTLPSAFTPFIYNLTTGILPKHKLQNIEVAQLRSADFNTFQPVGAGPFLWDTIEVTGNNPESAQQHIGLSGFPQYHAGKPKLDNFVIKTYASEEQLIDAFKQQDVSAIVGLEQIPDSLSEDESVYTYEAPYTAATMAFMRNTSTILKDKLVRQALVRSANIPTIVAGLSHPAILVDEPLLKGQLGYDPLYQQLDPSLKEANSLLDKAKWKTASPGQPRTRGSTPLVLKVYGKNNPDNVVIAQKLQEAWQAVGVKTEVQLQNDDELRQTITEKNYDILITGIAIGVDPDVFVYWHSSQADKRSLVQLNFSAYNSKIADASLTAGRTRGNEKLRIEKYKPFLEAWRNDAPALGLYQPRFLYLTRGPLHGFANKRLNNAGDRFINVENWMVREVKQVKP